MACIMHLNMRKLNGASTCCISIVPCCMCHSGNVTGWQFVCKEAFTSPWPHVPLRQAAIHTKRQYAYTRQCMSLAAWCVQTLKASCIHKGRSQTCAHLCVNTAPVDKYSEKIRPDPKVTWHTLRAQISLTVSSDLHS